MLIKLNQAQVEQYRSLLTSAARSGRRITPMARLQASLAAREFTPPPPRRMTQAEKDRETLRRAAAAMRRSA